MRGKQAEVGEVRVSKNGYSYTKTSGGWRLSHHLVAEKMLGRDLLPNEIVRFKGAKTDIRQTNIEVIQKGTTSARRRIAVIEARIEELEAEKAELLKQDEP